MKILGKESKVKSSSVEKNEKFIRDLKISAVFASIIIGAGLTFAVNNMEVTDTADLMKKTFAILIGPCVPAATSLFVLKSCNKEKEDNEKDDFSL